MMLLRDPVHGDIHLSKLEKQIINTPQFQRLRGIKQLGLVYLVFPGAMHTRFDHSIGTCYITKQILAEMKKKGYTPRTILSEKEEKEIYIAALIHDISHLPFGHSLEDEWGMFKDLKGREKHDKPDRFKELLSHSELGKILKDKRLMDPVIKRLSTNPLTTKVDFPDSKLWQLQVVSNTICSDLLDYIKRDSYFVGISLLYDQRIFKYFSIQDGKLVMKTEKHGMERLDARSDIINLLRCRCDLAEKVYLHHGVLAASAMIAKAIEIFYNEYFKNKEELLHFLLSLSDEQLLYELTACKNKSVKKLATRIINRKLYKRAFVLDTQHINLDEMSRLTERYRDDINNRIKTEKEIKEKISLPEDEEVIIYCAGTGALKEADVFITRDEKPIRLSVGTFRDRPNDVKELTDRYGDLWKLYVFLPPTYINKSTLKACNSTIGINCRYTAEELMV